MPITVFERLVTHEQKLTVVTLTCLCGFAWWYLWQGAGTGMNVLAMSEWQFPLPSMSESTYAGNWSLHYSIVMVSMWWIMMIAMMLPSASPMILLYGRFYRHHFSEASPSAAVGLFTLGYLLVWLIFSLAAASIHWILERSGIVHHMMMWITQPQISGVLLIAAGIYQLTPLKQACLRHCRSPVIFLSQYWQNGLCGALKMGCRHGLYCLGCCWLLMMLLFVGGAMNLYWIIGLSIWVLLEKSLPQSAALLNMSAALLIVAGSWVLL